LPKNVEQLPGAALDQMLLAGEIAALVETRGQTVFAPHIACLAADVGEAEASWYAETGLFPTLYTVVIKDRTLQERPGVAIALFEAFNSAKASALARLEAGVPLSDEEIAACKVSGFPMEPTKSSQRSYLGPDPLAYGFETNLLPMETVIRYALDQSVTYVAANPRELFLTLD
jgi:4,5-dihydroxyphthalate decarboxylase